MSRKYVVLGRESQVAMVDFGCNLTLARKCCRTVTYNGRVQMIAANITFRSKRDAVEFSARCREGLAFKAGKLGRWITPSFFVAELYKGKAI